VAYAPHSLTQHIPIFKNCHTEQSLKKSDKKSQYLKSVDSITKRQIFPGELLSLPFFSFIARGLWGKIVIRKITLIWRKRSESGWRNPLNVSRWFGMERQRKPHVNAHRFKIISNYKFPLPKCFGDWLSEESLRNCCKKSSNVFVLVLVAGSGSNQLHFALRDK
jgi:hypothetical protein